MKSRRDMLIGAATLAAVSGVARAQGDAMSQLAQRAALFMFPLYEMWRTRWNATRNPANPRRGVENTFGHARMLSDHRSRAVTTPNNDTLYSSAWLDLSQGPLVLAVPDTGERYYSLAFMDAWTNNFAYVGRRVTGTKAGRYLVAGPDWSGSAPDGHTAIRAPTNLVWLLGRTLVDSADDLAAATAIMQRYTLTPSAEPRTPSQLAPQDGAVPSDVDDAAVFFDIVRRARRSNPTAARDQPELDAVSPLGAFWAAGGDAPDAAHADWPAVKAGYAETRRLMRAARSLGGGGTMRGGWSTPPAAVGNYGTQYALRALVALTGLAALEPAEAMYLSADADHAGQPLSGAHRYVMRFEKAAMPPVDAFWSLSMYEVMPDARSFFTENPLNRFAVGDRSRHLRYGDDGSLELYLQRDPPEGGRASNWLPAPPARMRLTLRAYQPRAELLDGRYTPPPVRRVG